MSQRYGNSTWQVLLVLNKCVDEHAAANRRGKDVISWKIIEEIERTNGRFLEWENRAGLWIQNEDRHSIRTRIPIYFRDRKRNTRLKRKKRQKSLSVGILPYPRPNKNIWSMVSALGPSGKKRKIMGESNIECSLRFCLTCSFDKR